MRLLSNALMALRGRAPSHRVQLTFAARKDMVLLSAWAYDLPAARGGRKPYLPPQAVEVWIPLADFGLGAELEATLCGSTVNLKTKEGIEVWADELDSVESTNIAQLPFSVVFESAEQLTQELLHVKVREALRPVLAVSHRTVGYALLQCPLDEHVREKIQVEMGALAMVISGWCTWISNVSFAAFMTFSARR